MTHARSTFIHAAGLMITLTMLVTLALPVSILAGDAIPALNFSNSPRALSMGGCSATLVNEEAALFSPGALGLFHLDHVVGINLPNNSAWMGPSNDHRYRTWGASACPTYQLAAPGKSRQFRLAMAAGFSRLNIRYETIPIYQDPGNGDYAQIGSMNISDEVTSLTGAVGVEICHFVRLGAGCSYKRISNKLPYYTRSQYDVEIGQSSTSRHATDYGFMGQLLLHSLLPHKLFLGNGKKYYGHIELTPSCAFAKTNIGNNMTYRGNANLALPTMSYLGCAVSGCFKINDASLFSVYWTREIQTVKSSSAEQKPWGTEMGVGGILFFRSGTYISRDGIESDAGGFGLSLRGLTTWLCTLGAFDKIHGSLGEVLRRLDIRFDYAKLSPKDFPGAIAKDLAKSKYYKVTVSFAN
jgi:hypothetical protein